MLKQEEPMQSSLSTHNLFVFVDWQFVSNLNHSAFAA